MPISEYGFDTSISKTGATSNRDNEWEFKQSNTKRKPGGCATSLNVFECLGMEFDDCEEVIQRKDRSVFDRPNLKVIQAQNLMEVCS